MRTGTLLLLAAMLTLALGCTEHGLVGLSGDDDKERPTPDYTGGIDVGNPLVPVERLTPERTGGIDVGNPLGGIDVGNPLGGIDVGNPFVTTQTFDLHRTGGIDVGNPLVLNTEGDTFAALVGPAQSAAVLNLLRREDINTVIVLSASGQADQSIGEVKLSLAAAGIATAEAVLPLSVITSDLEPTALPAGQTVVLAAGKTPVATYPGLKLMLARGSSATIAGEQLALDRPHEMVLLGELPLTPAAGSGYLLVLSLDLATSFTQSGGSWYFTPSPSLRSLVAVDGSQSTVFFHAEQLPRTDAPPAVLDPTTDVPQVTPPDQGEIEAYCTEHAKETNRPECGRCLRTCGPDATWTDQQKGMCFDGKGLPVASWEGCAPVDVVSDASYCSAIAPEKNNSECLLCRSACGPGATWSDLKGGHCYDTAGADVSFWADCSSAENPSPEVATCRNFGTSREECWRCMTNCDGTWDDTALKCLQGIAGIPVDYTTCAPIF